MSTSTTYTCGGYTFYGLYNPLSTYIVSINHAGFTDLSYGIY
jgi:hypothetical protein